MDKIYKELNDKIREYLQEAEESDIFFIANIPVFYELIKQLDVSKITITDIEILDSCDGLTSLELSKDFLKYLNPKYEKMFLNAFNSGIIDFYDEDDLEYDKIRENGFSSGKTSLYDDEETNDDSYIYKNDDCPTYSYKKEYIKLLMNYSIRDSFRIVHEMMHHINYPIDDMSSTGRKTFGETISVLTETLFLEWLSKETDVTDEMIKEHKKARIFDTLIIIECLREQLPIIQTSLNLDSVDYENYKYYMELDNEIYMTKEGYDEICKCFLEDINQHERISSSTYMHYLFATGITSYIMNKRSHIKQAKNIINYLNDNINEMNEYMVLEQIGLDPNKDINQTIGKSLQKVINKYKNK